MKLCVLQENCFKYDSGSNKPPNHHVRCTIPCIYFLQSNCDKYLEWAYANGVKIACSIKEVNYGK